MPDRLYVRVTSNTCSGFTPVRCTLKKSSFDDKSKSSSGLHLLHSSYSLRIPCTQFAIVSWSYKTLERKTYFLHLPRVAWSTQVCKPHATVCLLHLPGILSLEPFLPAGTWERWIFFSLWLIGKPASTSSEKKTVCREKGSQRSASHLSADFFISCN